MKTETASQIKPTAYATGEQYQKALALVAHLYALGVQAKVWTPSTAGSKIVRVYLSGTGRGYYEIDPVTGKCSGSAGNAKHPGAVNWDAVRAATAQALRPGQSYGSPEEAHAGRHE